MLVSFSCPACHSILELDASGADGSQVECPHCHFAVKVPQPSLRPGTVLGGFRIESLIGRGGMGEVYLARQLSLDREVAVKVLYPELNLDKEEVHSFIREVRMAARLEHPNIVSAYEAGEDNGVYYMAMAYVEGRNAAEILFSEGPLPESTCLEIITAVASALAYAYEKCQMIHRDVKPENIMLDSAGEAKLTDLGLSTSLAESVTDPDNENIVGTPNYMSPEVVEGSSRPDFRADMYSLGATLYNMLTGTVPFEAASAEETMARISDGILADPRDLGIEVSAGCVCLLEIMLATDRAGRHKSWDDLIEDCRRVRKGGRPQMEPPEASATKVQRSARAEDTGGKIVIGNREKSGLRTRQQESRIKARRTARRRRIASLILVLLLLAAAAVFLFTEKHLATKTISQVRSVFGTAPSEDPATLKRLLSQTLRYWEDYPMEYDNVLSRLKSLKKRAVNTQLEERIESKIRKVKAAKQAMIQKTVSRLTGKARKMAAQGQRREAASFLRNYNGPFQEETAARRHDLIRKLGPENAAPSPRPDD